MPATPRLERGVCVPGRGSGLDKKSPAAETLAVPASMALVHNKPPRLSTHRVENTGAVVSAAGVQPRYPPCRRRGQKITTHANAWPAWLRRGCPQQTPIAFHGGCGKPRSAPGQKFTTPGMPCAAALARTCPHQTPMAFHVVCGKGGRRTVAGSAQKKGRRHRLRPGSPPGSCAAYSAEPPNLCVYCRLIVRPTVSNQDTS